MTPETAAVLIGVGAYCAALDELVQLVRAAQAACRGCDWVHFATSDGVLVFDEDEQPIECSGGGACDQCAAFDAAADEAADEADKALEALARGDLDAALGALNSAEDTASEELDSSSEYAEALHEAEALRDAVCDVPDIADDVCDVWLDAWLEGREDILAALAAAHRGLPASPRWPVGSLNHSLRARARARGVHLS